MVFLLTAISKKKGNTGAFILLFSLKKKKKEKRFTFSSYSETIYSMSISMSSQTEHRGIIFASGKREKE